MKNDALEKVKSLKTIGFYRFLAPPAACRELTQNGPVHCFHLGGENGRLGAIFTLLDASGQFVGDVGRGQDGPRI